jgi:Protein of unknown function (DUF688)
MQHACASCHSSRRSIRPLRTYKSEPRPLSLSLSLPIIWKMQDPNTQDPTRSPLHIKTENKFFARLLSKEISLSTPSFRIYGAAPTSVPFIWESQPGTPKIADSALSLPPITPPPSYQTDHNRLRRKDGKMKKSIFKFITSCFRRLGYRKPGTRLSKISFLPL